MNFCLKLKPKENNGKKSINLSRNRMDKGVNLLKKQWCCVEGERNSEVVLSSQFVYKRKKKTPGRILKVMFPAKG